MLHPMTLRSVISWESGWWPASATTAATAAFQCKYDRALHHRCDSEDEVAVSARGADQIPEVHRVWRNPPEKTTL